MSKKDQWKSYIAIILVASAIAILLYWDQINAKFDEWTIMLDEWLEITLFSKWQNFIPFFLMASFLILLFKVLFVGKRKVLN